MGLKIIIDSREKNPLAFRQSEVDSIIKRKLNVGDYTLEGYEARIAVERKSAIDLVGTLSGDITRFKKEIMRAKLMDYFVIVVEEPFINFYREVYQGSQFTEKRGISILRTCLTFKFKYGVDIIFCNDRLEAAVYVEELFKSYVKNGNRKPR